MKTSTAGRALIAGLLLATSSSAFAGWYNASWAYRKAITIDYTKVPNTDQTNFPVLVSLASDADLSARAQANGFDILFTASDGATQVPYEREQYSNGTLVAWVKAPALSHTTSTVLYLYYGNAAATDQQSASNVWDANYKGAWHLKENPRDTAPQMKDSTAGANNGTTASAFVAGDQQSAKIGGGLRFGGATNYDVAIANEPNFDFERTSSFSVEYWAKPVTNSGSTVKQTAVSKVQNSGAFPGYEIGHNVNGPGGTNTPGKLRMVLVNSATGTKHQIVVSTASVTKLNDGSWHHYIYTYSGSGTAAGVKIYQDGAALATSSDEDDLAANSILNSTPVSLGSRGNGGLYYNGLLDEVRISAAVRSPDWIATEYNNQSSPSTFYALGTEQAATTPTTTSVSRTSGGSPSTYGDSVTFTATVSGGATSTGNVIFNDGATSLATNALVSGQAAYTTTTLDVSDSPHSIAAYYQGDGTHGASDSSGSPVSQSVNKANPNVTAWPIASTITYGQTLGSSILSNGSATPAGSFVFTASSTAPNAGTASQSVTYMPADTVNYNTAGGLVSVAVNQANSSLAIGSSANPSTQGSNVTFTATVSPISPATTTPTGNVQFLTNGFALGSAVALNGGVATLSTAQLPAGSTTVTAVYAGSINFQGSNNSLVQVVNVTIQTPGGAGIAANGDGTVTITFHGTPGAQYLIQAVSDLGPSAGWENVSTNTAGPDGQCSFTDSTTTHSRRFYRPAKP